MRLGDADDALTAAGRPAGELRTMAAEADDAVRLANEAGRALVIPSAGTGLPACPRLPVPVDPGSQPVPFRMLSEGSGGGLAAVTVAHGGNRRAVRAGGGADDQPLVVEQRRDKAVREGHVARAGTGPPATARAASAMARACSGPWVSRPG